MRHLSCYLQHVMRSVFWSVLQHAPTGTCVVTRPCWDVCCWLSLQSQSDLSDLFKELGYAVTVRCEGGWDGEEGGLG